MIIRILTEGQFEVDDTVVAELNALDATLEAAVVDGDQTAATTALAALLTKVRETGTPVDLDALVPSDLVLPYGDATVAELRDLLDEDGLNPG